MSEHASMFIGVIAGAGRQRLRSSIATKIERTNNSDGDYEEDNPPKSPDRVDKHHGQLFGLDYSGELS